MYENLQIYSKLSNLKGMENILTSKIIKKFIGIAPETEAFIEQRREKLILVPTEEDPFPYLIKAIIHQQIAKKAALTVEKRFLSLSQKLEPERIKSLKLDKIRSCGMSGIKAGYILNVASAFSSTGELSHFDSVEGVEKRSNKDLIDLFTVIRGVGEWTVMMYLIFSLGRLNILADNDLAIMKGVQTIYNLEKLPTKSQVKKLAGHWDEFATVGCILCWRMLD